MAEAASAPAPHLVGAPASASPLTETPTPSPEPAAAAASVPSDELPVTPGSLTDAIHHLDAHAAAGRMEQAVALAARLDDHAADSLGLSHSDALRIREARARVIALAGDPSGAVRLYRDVAERWLYQGAVEQAEAVADRAYALWLEIPDLDAAIHAGVDMVRMRNQIPGDAGSGFTATLEHQARLEAAKEAAARAVNSRHARRVPQAEPAPAQNAPSAVAALSPGARMALFGPRASV